MPSTFLRAQRAWTHEAMTVTVRSTTLVQSSGSIASAWLVDPTTSQNSAVTTRRSWVVEVDYIDTAS